MEITSANTIFPLTKLSEDARKCQTHSAVFFGYSQLINLSAAASTPSTKIAPRGVKIMNRNHSFRFDAPFIRYRPADRLTNKLTASQFIFGYCYAWNVLLIWLYLPRQQQQGHHPHLWSESRWQMDTVKRRDGHCTMSSNLSPFAWLVTVS